MSIADEFALAPVPRAPKELLTDRDLAVLAKITPNCQTAYDIGAAMRLARVTIHHSLARLHRHGMVERHRHRHQDSFRYRVAT